MNFIFWNFTILYLYIYLEIFYGLIFFSTLKNLKFFIINFSKKINYFFFKNTIFSISINFFILYTITLKSSYITTNILTLLIVYLFINRCLDRYTQNNVMFINFNIFFFFFYIIFINSLIIFFLFIELYAILFYFIFLNINHKLKDVNLLSLKNNLLLYLFNNFFTTIIFLFSINCFIEFFGTVNFTELMYLNNKNINNWKLSLIIVTFIFKLSLPGFHYLKLEVYKYLNLENIIYFSVITLYVNLMLIIFLFNYNFILNIILFYKFFNLLLLFSFFFLIQKLQVNSLAEFIAYSGFATNNLILLNFII